MIELLVFQVTNVNFALPVEKVVSIQSEKDFESIDHSIKKKYINGIANIRDTVYAIVDLGKYFYNEETKSTNYILVKEHDNNLALNVDAVDGVIEIKEDAKIAVSSVLKNSHILYHIRYKDKLINVVNIDVENV